MGIWDRIQRWRNDDREFPPPWRELLTAEFPAYSRLPDALLRDFETHLKHFVWSKNWEGARGVEVTERMKVLVAAHAAQLAMRLPLEVYDGLESVVIYPKTFAHKEGEGAYGLAHPWGTVVLSWDAVERGLDNPADGRNTTLHEFAHVLDFEDGAADGTPLLATKAAYGVWGSVMGEHFERLRKGGRIEIALDEYGATNEAEFFAVATESFFEKPHVLKRVAPALYDVLRDFYRVDPLELEDERHRSEIDDV